jgi:DnaK suppressor protein
MPAKKKTVTKKVVAKKTPAKTVAKKAVATKDVAAKKTVAKKTVAKKAVVKKTPAKKAAVAPAKKTTAKKLPTAHSNIGPMGVAPYVVQKGKDYMDLDMCAHFEKILLLWRTDLMKEVDSTVDHLKQEDITSVADPVDRASLETDFSLELRTRDRERKLIRKIESAMNLLDHGEYGYCEDCGAEIGVRRLEARPTAMKCIDCKTFQEIKEKQGM